LRRVSHIHFVGGEKGGVGKSVVARLLAQWFLDRALPIAAVDADVSHGTLLRSYKEFTQPVDLDVLASADEIVNRALAAERSVVVDLPAQSGRALERWIESGDVARFAREAGIRLTLWHVTDGSFDSIRDLERTLDRWTDAFSYVAVKNHGRSKDFSLFDESAGRRRLEQQGGRVLDLLELDGAAMARIDRAGASFWAAANNAEGEQALAPLQRQRTKLWLDRCYQAFGAATAGQA
jgi:CobQ/CobB/MinD/ParA family nucleotide binding protein